jgi:hypothetical protein
MVGSGIKHPGSATLKHPVPECHAGDSSLVWSQIGVQGETLSAVHIHLPVGKGGSQPITAAAAGAHVQHVGLVQRQGGVGQMVGGRGKHLSKFIAGQLLLIRGQSVTAAATVCQSHCAGTIN